jgi:GT2 family glycosyltransferase
MVPIEEGVRPDRAPAPRAVVAVPARDEEERLPACLAALARQSDVAPGELAVVVLLNNTTDRSAEVVARAAAATGLCVHVRALDLPPERAHAGWARKLAMDWAVKIAPPAAVILTTDADTLVEPDWTARTRRAIEEGCDLVAGYVTADPEELSRVDPLVLRLGAQEWAMQHLLAEIDAKADPVPHDPWPRHNHHCGASLAITRAALLKVGGLPPVPVGEDRALVEAVRRLDGKVRHALDVRVVTSARVTGRARGGVADALRLRATGDYRCDELIEPARHALRRARWRSQARRAHGLGGLQAWARDRGLSALAAADVAAAPTFGQAWQTAERLHPALARVRLTPAALDAEIAAARGIIAALDKAPAPDRQRPDAA